MKLLSWHRGIREFGRTLWRNRWVSLMTALAMALVFFLTFLVFTANSSSERVIERVEAKVDIGVFFQKSAREFEIEAFLTELEKLKEEGKIRDHTYFSAEYALAEMKKKLPEKVRFLERYKFENPLQASVEIVPGTWQTEEIFEFLEQPRFRNLVDLQFLDRYTEKKVEVERILSFLAFLRQSGFALVLIFLVISAALIAFFVSSTLQQKKREIFIMRLVGAEHAFIRLPFILEGMALALFSFLVSFLLFTFFLEQIAPQVVRFFTSSADQVFMSELIFAVQHDFLQSFWWGLPLLLLLSSAISFGSVERFIRRRHLLSE